MSSKNPKLDALIERAREATLGRRALVQRGALGGGAALAALATKRGWVAAQGEADADQTSITREEYLAKLEEAFPDNPDAPQGGVFILGDSADINNTNVILANNSPTLDILGLMFETLYTTDATEAAYVPSLANRWDISEDGLTYTFYLHENVSWHDGTPFTANDVIFSFDAQANEETGSSYTGSFTSAVASYEMVDDYTVTVTAAEVLAPIAFFGDLYCPIMPMHLWEGVPYADWAADEGSTGQDPARVVGTGPFTFVEWIQGETVRLARNENYWNAVEVPNIDELIFQVWPDESTAVEALLAGDIDGLERIPPADIETVQGDESLGAHIIDTYSFTFYGYQMDPEKFTLFQEVEVRQALFYALDRQSIVDNIFLSYGVIAQGTQPVLSLAYAPDQIETTYDFSPERAMELLDGAGWVAGDDGVREKDGQRLAFEVMYTGGVAIYDQLVPYMQEAWAAIGAEMTPNAVDFGSVLVPAITETFDYQIALLGFNWGISADQSAMFSSDQYGTGFNFMRYSNPEVDELNDAASRELDPEARRALLIQATNLVNNDLPVGIFSFRQDAIGYNQRVQNWNPNAFGGLLWSLPYVYIEE